MTEEDPQIEIADLKAELAGTKAQLRILEARIGIKDSAIAQAEPYADAYEDAIEWGRKHRVQIERDHINIFTDSTCVVCGEATPRQTERIVGAQLNVQYDHQIRVNVNFIGTHVTPRVVCKKCNANFLILLAAEFDHEPYDRVMQRLKLPSVVLENWKD